MIELTSGEQRELNLQLTPLAGNIVFSDLVVPSSCVQGDTVEISVVATNTGSANQAMLVILSAIGNIYNDSWSSSQQVYLEPGMSRTLTFTFQPLVAQTYTFTVGGLSASLVVNPTGEWPGWTPGTYVTGLTVIPETVYLGETVQIQVAIQYPYPLPLPADIQAAIDVDGIHLSDVFPIEFRNPELQFSYTPTSLGTYTVVAQDKSATFNVLANPVANYYSPFGGVRMPLVTDILIPDVQPFVFYDFVWNGGDIRYSQLPSRMTSGNHRVGQFVLASSSATRIPATLLQQLEYAEPIEVSPAGASVQTVARYYDGDYRLGHSRGALLLVMPLTFTCPEYWPTKEDLANMIVGYCGNLGLSVPSEWAQYGVFSLCNGARDYQAWPGISSACTNSGYCTYTISCPFYTKRSPSVRPENFDKLSFARQFLDDIERDFPNHPLTEPAWF